MMKIDVLTLFPLMLREPLQQSILGKARQAKKIDINIHDLRDYTYDRHATADDTPFGGGGGMVMKPEPIFRALDNVNQEKDASIILLTPQGETFSQKIAEDLLTYQHLIFICGHYEGIDERVKENLVHREISIGDFICSGGEFPALIIIDVLTRLVPGVVGNKESIIWETFPQGFFDYPVYTRPREYRGLRVPDVLLSGNHAEIEKWRRKEALKNTLLMRPELLEQSSSSIDETDRKLILEIKTELKSKEKLNKKT